MLTVKRKFKFQCQMCPFVLLCLCALSHLVLIAILRGRSYCHSLFVIDEIKAQTRKQLTQGRRAEGRLSGCRLPPVQYCMTRRKCRGLGCVWKYTVKLLGVFDIKKGHIRNYAGKQSEMELGEGAAWPLLGGGWSPRPLLGTDAVVLPGLLMRWGCLEALGRASGLACVLVWCWAKHISSLPAVSNASARGYWGDSGQLEEGAGARFVPLVYSSYQLLPGGAFHSASSSCLRHLGDPRDAIPSQSSGIWSWPHVDCHWQSFLRDPEGPLLPLWGLGPTLVGLLKTARFSQPQPPLRFLQPWG